VHENDPKRQFLLTASVASRGRSRTGDEELGAVGIGAGVGHREQSGPGVLDVELRRTSRPVGESEYETTLEASLCGLTFSSANFSP
jgi:hypothetical protein